MRALVFLSLYGALTLVGAFLFVFWFCTAQSRLRIIGGRWTWWSDRTFILSTAIAISSAGMTLVDGGRLFGNLLYGLSPILQRAEAWPIGAGLALLLLGYMAMVWLADLERQPPDYRWLKRMGVVTILWLVASVFLAPHVPYYPV